MCKAIVFETYLNKSKWKNKMKNIKFIIILLVLSLFLASCTQKQTQEQPIYQKEEINEVLIISLEKNNEISKVQEKYEIYNTGKYITSLINKNKQETKKEGKLPESDLNYLKSLISSKEFSSIPNYMEGAGQECPVILLKINFNNLDRLVRAESCANTPEAFNKITESIEKLK